VRRESRVNNKIIISLTKVSLIYRNSPLTTASVYMAAKSLVVYTDK
jgi:hypothetical protein